VRDVSVDTIVIEEMEEKGLYFYFSERVHIGRYTGRHNGHGIHAVLQLPPERWPNFKDFSDLYGISSTEIVIDEFLSERAQAGVIMLQKVAEEADAHEYPTGSWSIGRLRVIDPAPAWMVYVLDGRLDLDRYEFRASDPAHVDGSLLAARNPPDSTNPWWEVDNLSIGELHSDLDFGAEPGAGFLVLDVPYGEGTENHLRVERATMAGREPFTVAW